ncbi:hypothetical protein P7C73_g5688, partial [Tremellales sp. Uapishka_1]
MSLYGAVVSEHYLASEIGIDILSCGGNAADALVATVIAVNTLCPYHSDLGGGGFAIIRQSDGIYKSLDFRHTAPLAATAEFYKDKRTDRGGTAVAVPGELKGLEEIHSAYGQLSWEECLAPSIRLAREGMPMGGDFTVFLKQITHGKDSVEGTFLATNPEYRHFLGPEGKLLAVGETFYRPGYADVLERIAQEGSSAFYEGEVAKSIVEAVTADGGLLSLDDLKNYTFRYNTPLSADYHGYKLVTVPAPASGAIWLSAMGTLSHFKSTESGDVLDLHRLTEALRLAYGQRTQLGDPSFVDGLDAKQASWISPESTAKRAKMVSDDHTFPPEYYKPPQIEIKNDNGTSNITVADSSGLVISVTTTVGLIFGSTIIVPKHGIVLNDSMDDFSVHGRPNGTGYEPSPANYIVGGKRPLSSSCPYIVEDASGNVVLAGGAAGGSTIISANTQVVRNVLVRLVISSGIAVLMGEHQDYGMSATEALWAARLHNQILPNVSQVERTSVTGDRTVNGFTEEQARGLETKGHVLEWVDKNRSTPCAIKFFPRSSWEPGCDPRKIDAGGASVELSRNIEPADWKYFDK